MSQELKISRKKAIVYCVAEIIIIGIITILGYSYLKNVHPLSFIEAGKGMDILDSLDFISNKILMPIGAIFTTILVVAVIGLERISSEIKAGAKWYRQFIYQFCMCVVVIPFLLIILLSSLKIF